MNEKNILFIYNIISHIIQLILFDLIFPFEFLFVLANKNFRLNYFLLIIYLQNNILDLNISHIVLA
jgi:hypothetical protein